MMTMTLNGITHGTPTNPSKKTDGSLATSWKMHGASTTTSPTGCSANTLMSILLIPDHDYDITLTFATRVN